MADEQSQNTPSVESGQSDAPVSEPTSSEDKQPSRPGWWTNLFRRRGDPEPSESEPQEPAKPETEPSKLSLTQEELERRIQAETDRREAKRAQEARYARKRELRESDPWKYVEEERKEEELAFGTGQLEQFVTNIGSEHDKVTIDQVFLALPQQEQERIGRLEGAGHGLEGRKMVVQESLKALEKHWKAEGARDAEARLRKNQAFRKQVLGEMRGQTAEPELLSGGSPSEADKTVSGLLRDYYRLG